MSHQLNTRKNESITVAGVRVDPGSLIVADDDGIVAFCSEYAVSLPALAAQFPLAHAAATTVVLGMSRPEEVVNSAELLARKIPPALWLELKSEGLPPQEAPVPA